MSGGGTYSRIVQDLAAWGIGPLDEAQRELLGVFVREVALWSGRIHLIGKSNIRKTMSNLVVDSWVLYQFALERGFLRSSEREGRLPGTVKIADVGAGAGFPGIIWKIAMPDLDVTLFERREKTLRFLERVVALMKTDGIRAVGGDAGRAGSEGRYDVVVSKAAGRLRLLAGVVTRLLREGGAYITVKGSGWESEIEHANSKKLQLSVAEELPAGRGTALAFVREGGVERE
jgi:16S rRNA (guanine(527)-N(7))-methyltransferase RsmG